MTNEPPQVGTSPWAYALCTIEERDLDNIELIRNAKAEVVRELHRKHDDIIPGSEKTTVSYNVERRCYDIMATGLRK